MLKTIRDLITNKWFKFGINAFFYLLWVIWLGNYWFLIGLAIIFDIFITEKVHWAFWKKKGVVKQTKTVEWIDAIIFAVIAASFIRTFFIEAYTIPTSSMEKTLLVGDYLFVSKASYGPRLPMTPIAVPFAHHTMPFTQTTKAYVNWIENPYRRLIGTTSIYRNDEVVFNFPEGDTVVLQHQDQSYYELVRELGREKLWANFDIAVRPVDKRENYIKRCVGVPGDTLQLIHGQLFVNGKEQDKHIGLQYKYIVETDGSRINEKILQDMGVSKEDINNSLITPNTYILPLVEENVEKLRKFKIIKNISKYERPKGQRSEYIFPHSPDYNWNEDNFGPIYIPKKGDLLELDAKNIAIYHRLIETYEQNKLEIKENQIYINDKL
ncbi:MAG: signal peptidase I, partial [Bacteroidales bacterium]|nr:signal peptidase I [Bacteroidales bacterium]